MIDARFIIIPFASMLLLLLMRRLLLVVLMLIVVPLIIMVVLVVRIRRLWLVGITIIVVTSLRVARHDRYRY